MRKVFCDICGKEIKNPDEEGGSVSIYDNEHDDTIIDYDLCNECIEKVKEILQNLKKEEK